MELDAPFRGELIVGLDFPVDSFNQMNRKSINHETHETHEKKAKAKKS